jgi:hypothetical protein
MKVDPPLFAPLGTQNSRPVGDATQARKDFAALLTAVSQRSRSFIEAGEPQTAEKQIPAQNSQNGAENVIKSSIRPGRVLDIKV